MSFLSTAGGPLSHTAPRRNPAVTQLLVESCRTEKEAVVHTPQRRGSGWYLSSEVLVGFVLRVWDSALLQVDEKISENC